MVVLAFAFWYGGDAPGLHGWKPQPKGSETVAIETEAPDIVEEDQTPDLSEEPAAEVVNEEYSEETAAEINEAAEKPEPLPVEPQDAEVSDEELTCTLSIRCDTILDNMAWLDPEKVELVPEDGIIYAERTVTFYEGESVFDLLLRETRQNKIHMEYENTPVYNSAYIEGIGNLYEFDCGELSGWMYKVNDWFPGYGCSRYLLSAGDRVEWVYTCNLGADVGNGI